MPIQVRDIAWLQNLPFPYLRRISHHCCLNYNQIYSTWQSEWYQNDFLALIISEHSSVSPQIFF